MGKDEGGDRGAQNEVEGREREDHFPTDPAHSARSLLSSAGSGASSAGPSRSLLSSAASRRSAASWRSLRRSNNASSHLPQGTGPSPRLPASEEFQTRRETLGGRYSNDASPGPCSTGPSPCLQVSEEGRSRSESLGERSSNASPTPQRAGLSLRLPASEETHPQGRPAMR
jgi:hypothetical protein